MIFNKLLLFILPILALLSTSANARDYDVEIIVFERQPNSQNSPEDWDFSSQKIQNKIEEISQLGRKKTPVDTFSSLSRLAGAQSQLINSGYRILESARWRQPANYYQNAPVVQLGEVFPPLIDSASSDNSSEDLNVSTKRPLGTILSESYVRVYKTSLIFVDLKLHLLPEQILMPVTNENTLDENSLDENNLDNNITDAFNSDSELNSNSTDSFGTYSVSKVIQPHFFIDEKRRLKFKEIHYFDHPKFGAILTVWPVEES